MNGAERGLGHWLARPWRLTFDYGGRSPRREFWLFVAQFYLVLFGLGIALATIPGGFGKKGAPWGLPLTLTIVAVLLLLLPLLAAAVRRVHDHDKSGWMILLMLVPAVGWVFFLILMCTAGDADENLYGPDPRDPQLTQREMHDIFG